MPAASAKLAYLSAAGFALYNRNIDDGCIAHLHAAGFDLFKTIICGLPLLIWTGLKSIAALHVEEPLASQLLPCCVTEADSALKPTTGMWATLTSFVF